MTPTPDIALLADLHTLLTGQAIIDMAWPCFHDPECGQRESNKPHYFLGDDWMALKVEWGGHYWPVFASPSTPTPEGVADWSEDARVTFDARYWYEPVPDYCSWSGLGLVIEAMTAKGYIGQFAVNRRCVAEFIPPGEGHEIRQSVADTLPLAVARAALAALKGQA